MADPLPVRSDSIVLVGPGPKATLATAGTVTAGLDPTVGGHANRLQVPEQLPILLAGPVLRTVTASSVTIWMATSVDLVAECSIQDPESGDILAHATAASTRLGDKLFISITEVQGAFPVGKLLAYNFICKLGANPGVIGFLGNSLLEPADVALYGLSLPTFFIPADGPNQRFLHASCRKLHGPGRDAIDSIAELLDSHPKKLSARPSALFLTGDQIYADDVDPGILEGVSLLGRTLLGWEEALPGGPFPHVSDIPPGSRHLVRSFGYSVDQSVSENHLIGFGEFAAMYLLAWNPVLWSWPKLRERKPFLRSARDYTPRKIRVVLANVPCYMQFDDHEITDDWYLNALWMRETDNPTARLMIANGIAAYWAFQASANPLNGRDASVRSAVLAYLNGRGADPDSFRNAVLSFRDWSYIAPSRPPALVLDTRTCREFPAIAPTGIPVARENYPPGLMDKASFATFAANLAAIPGGPDDPLVIVSPAPYVGYRKIENLQKLTSNIGSDTKPIDPGKDPEAWGFNDSAFATFIRKVAASGRTRVIVLSGDVHYAFTAISRCVARIESREVAFSLVQLTASALKNMPNPLTETVVGIDEPVYGLVGSPMEMKEMFSMEMPAFWNTRIMWRYLGMGSMNPLANIISKPTSIIAENNFGLVTLEADRFTHHVITPDSGYQASALWSQIPNGVADLMIGRPPAAGL